MFMLLFHGCDSNPQGPANGPVCISETMQFCCFPIVFFLSLNYGWLLIIGETLTLFFLGKWVNDKKVEPPETPIAEHV